jgi:hypothetical protein
VVSGADRTKLVVDPGARTLNGPDQKALFDTGTFSVPPSPATLTVPLGEMRTDAQSRLLILGGFGKSASPNGVAVSGGFNSDNWHDDVSDGPVSATVKIGADTFDAVGAWVIVAPPKFAPPIDQAVTLYDRLLQFFIDNMMAPPFNDPSPSYTKYIYPILERARRVGAVESIPAFAHKWNDPVVDPMTRSAIFGKLKRPDGSGPGDMPLLANGTDVIVALTKTQYGIMQQWNGGTFTNDWAGVPSPPANITPEGQDIAALETCIGAAFYPGIEAGQFLISTPAIWSSAFRLDPSKVNPGDVTAQMSVPWQTDFFACQASWWPPARPNNVLPQGGTTTIAWSTGVGNGPEMVDKWSILGFVVQQGPDFVDTERCPSTFISLLTPNLNFRDVPQGPMGMSRKMALAIAFEVESPGGPVTLEYVSGPAFSRLQRFGGNSVTVGPTAPSTIVTARLWITYETGGVGESISDTVVIGRQGTTQQWTVHITANTVARKKAAAAMILDRSGSMTMDRGDGTPKIQSLREAASIFVDVMLQDDAVSLVRFNQDAQLLQPVTPLGSPSDPFDPGRTLIKNTITGPQLDPAGQTSIGDGISSGRTALNAATGYDVKSLLVLTDGIENHSLFISDVAPQIDEFTYGIGLGKPENISATALQTISGNHGGYLLVTGPITGDNRFLLQKYFLQILAGISNADVVLDPQGDLSFGTVHRIPFSLSEADAGVDVILLSPYAGRINFRLQTPSSYMLDPANITSHSGAIFVRSNGVNYYRLRLPFEYLQNRFDREGTWHAILQLGKTDQPGIVSGTTGLVGSVPAGVFSNAWLAASNAPFRFVNVAPTRGQAVEATAATGFSIPYSLIVHTYSDVRLFATAAQDSFAPGSLITLRGMLTEYGIPIEQGVQMWADVVRPVGTPLHIDLTNKGNGQFEGTFTTGPTGAYSIRIQAAASSRLGWKIRREQTVTAISRFGGDPPHDGGNPALCALLNCLVRSGALNPEFLKRLTGQGIDFERLIACVCSGGKPTGDQFPDA